MKRLVVSKGNVFAKVMIIGEAPGSQEDLEGIPYVGRSGKLLNLLLEEIGFIPNEDIYFCNVIKCRPQNNRKPSKKEIDIYKPWLIQQIKLVDPKFVILTGSIAMKTILGCKEPISKIRGNWIKIDQIEYMTIFHPSYLLRFSTKKKESPKDLTLNDLHKVRKKLYSL